MNNESSTQIGAKTLTKAEINLILPSYDRILSQIEEIRKESNLSTENNIQKTNNISVLGVRGSGKTSILKSIINDLEKENNNKNEELNIIFPMIIPENMSEKMDLLSTILGLFKKKVDEIENKNKEKSQNCWEKTTTEVSKKYNSLLKKYCHMQSEFRQVSIDEFISESNYVRKNAEIFNADSEFINDFNKFITELTQKTNTLIFFFIDDIDLSTNRCTDIIKTLLSYMSHPKIVTILSGDLDTFAEELTIDFLKKGNLLHKDLLDVSFINNNKENILERKKTLSYEYLKKIIPPIYRHNLKTWSLKNRAQFKSATTIDGKENDNNPLVELLADTFRDYDCEALFQYYDFNEEDENKRIKPIPQMFYMFDDTSRGLNNVYNSLLQVNKYIKDDNNKKDNDYDTKCFQYIRNFLETVISSNKILNSNFSLLNNVITMGSSFEDTSIDCEYFYNSEFNGKDIPNEIEDKKAIILCTLFSFYDFAIRVLKKTEIFNNSCYRSTYINISQYILYSFFIKKTSNIGLLAIYNNFKSPYSCDFSFLFHFLNSIKMTDFNALMDHYNNDKEKNYYYILGCLSYKKVLKKSFFNLFIVKNHTFFLEIFNNSFYTKINNKVNIAINRLLKDVCNKWIEECSFESESYPFYYGIYKNILYNYLINFMEFSYLKNTPISKLTNTYLNDNKSDDLIKCILEIDDRNLWNRNEVFQIITKIESIVVTKLKQINKVEIKEFSNYYNKYLELYKNNKYMSCIYQPNLLNLDFKHNILKKSDYFDCIKSIKMFFNNSSNDSSKQTILVNSVKMLEILTTAEILIDVNEEEFKFWIYAYLRSKIHKIDYNNSYIDECIADLIDELYDFFEKNDIYDNSKIENKLTPESISTIEELSKLEKFDFENTDEEKSEHPPNNNETLEEAGKTQNLNTNTENPSHDINTSKNNNKPQNNEVNETQIYPQSNKKFKSKIKVKKLNNIMNSNLISISLIMKFRKKKAQDTSRTTNESGE